MALAGFLTIPKNSVPLRFSLSPLSNQLNNIAITFRRQLRKHAYPKVLKLKPPRACFFLYLPGDKKKGLLPSEWVLFETYSAGNIHVSTLRRRYS